MKTKPGFWPFFFIQVGWRAVLIGVPIALFAWGQAGFAPIKSAHLLIGLVVFAPMFLLLALAAYGYFRSRAVPDNWHAMSAREQAVLAAKRGTSLF
jgi:hypothetical protein